MGSHFTYNWFERLHRVCNFIGDCLIAYVDTRPVTIFYMYYQIYKIPNNGSNVHLESHKKSLKMERIGINRGLPTMTKQVMSINPYIEEEQTTQWPTEKGKRTNNYLQNTTQTTKYRVAEPH